MNPLVVCDCATVVPNRFAIVLAAAARSRALNRGAQPRSGARAAGTCELALCEIAEDAFAPEELVELLDASGGQRFLPAPDRPQAPEPTLSPGAPETGAGAPVSRDRETVH